MNRNKIDQALKSVGIEALNPMQEKALEHATDRRDMILLSPTGSGKTLAYLLPLLLILEQKKSLSGFSTLILVPSRELAVQVNRVFTSLKSGYNSVCCYGGHALNVERNALLAGDASVLIGTPGRILDHMYRGNIDTSAIDLLIIDEFDKALEFGFHEEMSDIISLLPVLKRRILLSATDADEIPQFTGVGRMLKLNYLDENQELGERLELMQVHSPNRDKLDTLYNLLCTFGNDSAIVFCNHRDAVDRTNNYLRQKGLISESFHGGLEQDARERALYKFSNGSSYVLVSTDLAARGLDIPQVEHIIHYHLPINEESFTHRNGRTARWEAKGTSYIILHDEEQLPDYIESTIDLFEFPQHIPEPQESDWVTLYIGKGKKDNLNVVDIVGFMHKKGKLGRDELGKVDLKDHFAYVAVKRKKVKQLLQLIHDEKIKGMKTIFQEAY